MVSVARLFDGLHRNSAIVRPTLTLPEAERPEVKNDKALQVIERVRRKLAGRDFKADQILGVPEQVNKLVDEATKTENLCVAFLGWCSFW